MFIVSFSTQMFKMKATPLFLLCIIGTTRGKLEGINENGCPTDYTTDKVIAHENCDQYYQCLNGVPVARFCPSGLHFNPILGKCDWPAEAKCSNNQEDLDDIPIKRMRPYEHVDSETSEDLDKSNPNHATLICAGTDSNNVLVAHEYCNHFYKCSFGKAIALRCAKNLLYNLVNEKCDLPSRVECGDRSVPTKEEINRVNHHRIINRSRSSEQNSLQSTDRYIARTACEKSGSDGVLSPHEYCDHYYKCQNGQPSAMKCPDKLLYNHIKKYCDWPRNVFCGDRTMSASDQKDSTSDNEDENNNTSEQSNESKDNAVYSDPSRAHVICAAPNSDGILIAHERCNKFYKCAGGRPIALLCPDNLLYNPYKEHCDWSRSVNCDDRTLVDKENGEEFSGETEENDDINVTEIKRPTGNHSDPSRAPSICFSPGSDGTMVAHENCHQFYKCHDGLPVAIQCPAGLLYNSTEEYCDWPSNVECGDRIRIDVENDTDNSILSSHILSNNYSEPKEAASICQADYSDGVFVAHKNCNQFYKCYDKKPVTFSCQLNLLYDPLKEYCDWPRNVNCGTRKVPELADVAILDTSGDEGYDNVPRSCVGRLDGEIIPNEHCSQFSKCIGETGHIMNCPPGLYFNTVLKACDWPMNVNCGSRLTEPQIVKHNKNSRRALSFIKKDL